MLQLPGHLLGFSIGTDLDVDNYFVLALRSKGSVYPQKVMPSSNWNQLIQ